MAGDWIKWTKGLSRKREVVAISARLGVSRYEVAARLMDVWEWADENTADGDVASVTKSFLDDIAGVTGFSDAMTSVGWLLDSGDGLHFPNFQRHNGQSAKQRALTADRMRKHRTTALRSERNKIVTREEKRRDTTIPISLSSQKSKFKKPNVVDVAIFCTELKLKIDPQDFCDYYEAQGWRLSNGNAMKDWQAAVRRWARGKRDTAPKEEPYA